VVDEGKDFATKLTSAVEAGGRRFEADAAHAQQVAEGGGGRLTLYDEDRKPVALMSKVGGRYKVTPIKRNLSKQ